MRGRLTLLFVAALAAAALAQYPGGIYDADTPATRADATWTQAENNAHQAETEAIQTELGTNPSGASTTVRERLEAIEAAGGSGDITDVGDCSTGACFQTGTQHFFLGFGPSGKASMRAIVDAALPSSITRDTDIGSTVQAWDADLDDLADGSLTGTTVGFSDPAARYTAVDIDAALAELFDVVNGGVPNGSAAKVDWSQLNNVPAGFADGTDDGGGGGSGDIEAVWGCTTGDCSALTAAAGDTLDATLADSTAACKSGTAVPGTCAVGECFFDSDATAGRNLFLCTATDTWTEVQGTGGGGSPLTTKGDLFTFDTSDSRLPVGTDGHVLTADSGEATGIKWAAASGGSGATLVRKTSTESVSNSTTLQDDDALFFAIGANEVWQFEFIINVDGPSNADMKVGVKGPTGVGGFFTVSGMELTVASTPGYEQTRASTGISASPSGVSVGVLLGGHTVRIYGLAANGGTAGNITLQWAQNAGNATATNVTVNSHLIAYRVS